MKTKLIATLILAGSSLFAGPRISFGVGFGAPVVPAPSPEVAYVPPCPGPGYAWIDGYYTFVEGRRVWHEGYWGAPVFREGFREGHHFDGRFHR
jgi:hypothetical protein